MNPSTSAVPVQKLRRSPKLGGVQTGAGASVTSMVIVLALALSSVPSFTVKVKVV